MKNSNTESSGQRRPARPDESAVQGAQPSGGSRHADRQLGPDRDTDMDLGVIERILAERADVTEPSAGRTAVDPAPNHGHEAAHPTAAAPAKGAPTLGAESAPDVSAISPSAGAPRQAILRQRGSNRGSDRWESGIGPSVLISLRGWARPPRTAFLPSAIAPPSRGSLDALPAMEESPGESTGAGLDAGFDLGPEAGVSLDEIFESNEPLLTAEELDAFFSPDPIGSDSVGAGLIDADLIEPDLIGPGNTVASENPTASTTQAEPATTDVDGEARPDWLKRQVADLADLVQALDLRARTNHSHLVFDAELTRLRHFTRTIGFVASPPMRGHQVFDLAEFVEEHLGQAAGRSPDAPRLLFRRRGDRDPIVTADRALVALAMDAVLQTAIAASSSGDVVRVSVESTAETPYVRVRIDFPAGPLAGLSPAEIQRPYGLRQHLPEIGPNALAAAGAIAVGQGGDLTLEELSGGRLAFDMDLA